MARPQMPAAQWLERIATMRRQAQPGDTANLTTLAKGLGITPAYFRRVHIDGDEQFPVAATGTEGRDYVFDVIAALNHLFWRCWERLERERAETARVARLTGSAGGGPGEPTVEADGLGSVSVSDLGKLIDVNQRLMRARQDQGDLIPKARVSEFLIAYNTEVQSGVLGAEQKVDPLGTLPVDVRVQVHETLRQKCIDLTKRIERFLNPDEVVAPKRAARRR